MTDLPNPSDVRAPVGGFGLFSVTSPGWNPGGGNFKSVSTFYFDTTYPVSSVAGMNGLPYADLGMIEFWDNAGGLIYTSNAQPLVFGTASTERMRFTGDGLVGIGTPAPMAKLDVVLGTGAPSPLDVDFPTNTAGLRFRRGTQLMGSILKNAGGPLVFSSSATNAPDATTDGFQFITGNLNVSSGNIAAQDYGFGRMSASVHAQSLNDPDHQVRDVFIEVRNSLAGTANVITPAPAVPFQIIPSADSGEVVFQNLLNAVVYTDNLAPLIFGTNGTERMRIAADGGIGIGISTPVARLHVVGSLGTQSSLIATSSDNAQATNIIQTLAQNGTIGIALGYDTIRMGGTSPFSNMTINAKGTGHLILQYGDGSGRVGIGTATPSDPLQVIGTISAQGPNTSAITRVQAQGSEGSSGFAVSLLQFGSARTDTGPLGLTSGGLGQLLFQNTSNAVISTNGPTTLRLGTYDVERISISAPASGFADIQIQGQVNIFGDATHPLTAHGAAISTSRTASTGLGPDIASSGAFLATQYDHYDNTGQPLPNTPARRIADGRGCFYA